MACRVYYLYITPAVPAKIIISFEGFSRVSRFISYQVPMNDSQILIREAIPSEAEVITRFQLAMAQETENLELEESITKRGVEAVFNNPDKGTYYVACIEGQVVGSMLTTPEWSDWRNQTILWIQSVYVLPEFRQLGVFRSLFHTLLKKVDENPIIGGVRLYVDERNEQARKVYTRLGMNGGHYGVFEMMKS